MTVFYDINHRYDQEDTCAWMLPMETVILILPFKRRPWSIQATARATLEWQMEWQLSNNRNICRLGWSHRLSYDRSMLEYKVIKFPPWLFSMMLNTAIIHQTHAPDSHQWKLLPWFCLLRQQPCTIQSTAGATGEWHLDWQWSKSRSVGRVRWSHRLSYDHSMLENKFIKFPPWLFSTMLNTTMSMKTHAPDSHRWKPLTSFCVLRWRP